MINTRCCHTDPADSRKIEARLPVEAAAGEHDAPYDDRPYVERPLGVGDWASR